MGTDANALSSSTVMPVRVVFRGKTYDVPRDFVFNEHPGGADTILDEEGGDITASFDNAGHTEEAEAMFRDWLVAEEEEVNKSAATGAEEEVVSSGKATEVPISEDAMANKPPVKNDGPSSGPSSNTYMMLFAIAAAATLVGCLVFGRRKII